MHWMSILGLILILVGTILSTVGTVINDKKGQEELKQSSEKKIASLLDYKHRFQILKVICPMLMLICMDLLFKEII